MMLTYLEEMDGLIQQVWLGENTREEESYKLSKDH